MRHFNSVGGDRRRYFALAFAGVWHSRPPLGEAGRLREGGNGEQRDDDAFTPPPQPGTPLIPPAVPGAKALYDNIQRLKLDVQVIAPFHGNRTTTVAELAGAAGVAATK